jgi:thioredoxin 1
MFIQAPLCDFVTESAAFFCYNGLTKNSKGDKNMSAIKINQNEFQKVRENSGVSLLDFYADWCGPCRMVLPLVEQIGEEREDLLVAKINVDENPDLAKEFGVFSIPTLVVMKDGQVVNKVSGARPKDKILELVNV